MGFSPPINHSKRWATKTEGLPLEIEQTKR
jgi:hypothetical protein